MTHTEQPQYLSLLINWVERGIPPERLTQPSVGSAGGGCPFPQQAKFLGGSISDPANYVCGGNVQTPAVICMLLTTPLGMETSNLLQSYGPKVFPAGC